ncbi:hypothetical protein L7F22_008674 [Adiantum nelumboides]|nr:hypothetical protein [Adiantum nelumboides]
MAQAAHASLAVSSSATSVYLRRPSLTDTQIIARTRDSAATQAYLAPDNVAHMRKVVLQTPKDVDLASLSRALQEREDAQPGFPRHHVWIEMPEGVPTVLAIEPNERPPVREILFFA